MVNKPNLNYEIDKSEKMTLKTYKSLPVHVVEDHDDALKYMYKCMGSRYLPLEGNSIIHIDSHPDLMVPRDMAADTVWNKYKLFQELDIEDWLIPACYAGHFNTIHWVKPSWSNQIPLGTYKIYVGKYENRIRLFSSIYYFLSDGLCIAKNLMENVRELTLSVTSMTDLEYVQRETADRHYILDVDLDFFSTSNPFKEIFKSGNLYDKLRLLFGFEVPDKIALNVGRDQPEDVENERLICEISKKRSDQLAKLRYIFEKLNDEKCIDLENLGKGLPEKSRSHLEEVFNCVTLNYVEPNWWLIHSAGLTCDATELPHHVSTKAEILEGFCLFEEFLKSLKRRPIMITVARSTRDDYCPLDQIEFIQNSVLEILEKVFGNIVIHLNY